MHKAVYEYRDDDLLERVYKKRQASKGKGRVEPVRDTAPSKKQSKGMSRREREFAASISFGQAPKKKKKVRQKGKRDAKDIPQSLKRLKAAQGQMTAKDYKKAVNQATQQSLKEQTRLQREAIKRDTRISKKRRERRAKLKAKRKARRMEHDVNKREDGRLQQRETIAFGDIVEKPPEMDYTAAMEKQRLKLLRKKL